MEGWGGGGVGWWRGGIGRVGLLRGVGRRMWDGVGGVGVWGARLRIASITVGDAAMPTAADDMAVTALTSVSPGQKRPCMIG